MANNGKKSKLKLVVGKKLGRPKKPIKSLIEYAIDKLSKSKDRYSFYSPISYYSVVDYETQYIDGKTIGAIIHSIDMNELVNQFLDKKDTDINAYTVDRILRSSKLREPNRWSAIISSGYYNDFYIGTIRPSQNIIDGLIEVLIKAEPLSDAEKVKLCLQQEYGYLLPQLKSINSATIIEVPIENVKMGSDSYMRRLEKEFVDQYDEFKLPRGIVMSCGIYPDDENMITYGEIKDTTYRLIDGYNRMTSAHNQNLKKVKVIDLH